MLKSEDKKKKLDYEKRRILDKRRVSLEAKQEERIRSKVIRIINYECFNGSVEYKRRGNHSRKREEILG